MDQLVDQAVVRLASEMSKPADGREVVGTALPSDPGDQSDIESELYCSTREMGISPVGFGPVADA